MQRTLNKQQRLKSEQQIATLMKSGKAQIAYPIRICYLSTSETENRIMVSVPKRLFKRAVKRNLLKRRLREAYRLNQQLLEPLNSQGIHFDIAMMYISPEVATFEQIQKAVVKALNKIINTAK